MKRRLAALVLIAGCAEVGPARHETPVNERPMYGGVFKNSAMRLADESFIETAKKEFSSKRSASDHYAELGWKYLRADDARTAIKRFNQCWLIEPENPQCTWGFGMFEGQSGNTDQAIVYLEQSHAMLPSSTDLHVDLAIGYAQKARELAKDRTLAAGMFAKATAILEAAAKAEPTNQKVVCVWTAVLAESGDAKQACQLASRCKDDRDGVRRRLACP
jgi:Flp pilus assembly protein TadD